MDIQRIAAFALNGEGGNPAGVVVGDVLPDVDVMQKVAADVGYSETVFAAPVGDNGYRVRYFAPEAEVAFCGHATIALGAALGAARGAGRFALELNDAHISVDAFEQDGVWGARLTSPETSFAQVPADLRRDALALFGWDEADLDTELGMAMINGGAQHLVIPLRSRDLLSEMEYDFDTGAALMRAHGLVTVNLVWRESERVIYSRNPFAGHGVYEDPATGAAGAALAGFLRDSGVSAEPFVIYQGGDMGVPSRLEVAAMAGKGAPVEVAGGTRVIG